MNLDTGPLTEEVYEICLQHERYPASELQTALAIRLSGLGDKVEAAEREVARLRAKSEELKKAHAAQQKNYLELYYALIGDGSTTSDMKDPVTILKEMRAELTQLRAQSAELLVRAERAEAESKYRGEMSDSWRGSYELGLKEAHDLKTELAQLRERLGAEPPK